MQTNQGVAQLDALGDPSRRAIVALLSQEPASVGLLAEQLPISRPAVSQHLRVLKQARLVTDQARGTRRIYALDSTGLTEIRAFLSTYWHADLQDFAAFVDEHVKNEGVATVTPTKEHA